MIFDFLSALHVPPNIHNDFWMVRQEKCVHLLFACFVTGFFLLLRQPLRTHVFRPIGRFIGVKQKEVIIKKYEYQVWLFTYYTSTFFVGMNIISKELFWGSPIFKEPRLHMWIDYPHCDHSALLGYYYLVQLGFYVEELCVLFYETRRSDFLQYVFHHAVTIVMIVGSYITCFNRVGVVIFVIHDFSDILLCFCKVCHYSNHQTTKTFFFALFALSFFITRLVVFPMIIYSIIFETVLFIPFNYVQWTVLVLLFALVFLHIFWFTLIMKMVFIALKAQKLESDIRSDDSD